MGLCFHVALSPASYVAVQPVRLVIYGSKVAEPSFKEVDVLMLSGKLQPTRWKCLGPMSRTICTVCVEDSSYPRLMPPKIHYIRQTLFLLVLSQQTTL